MLYFSTPIKSVSVPSEKDEPDEIFSTPEPVRESTVEKCSSMEIFELCETLDPTSTFFEKLEKITTISSGCETIMNPDTPEIDTGDTMDTVLDTVKEIKQSKFHWNWVLIFPIVLFVINTWIFVYFYGRFVNLQNELTQLREAVLSNNLKNLREEKTDLVVWYNFWENLMQYLFKVYTDIAQSISILFK